MLTLYKKKSMISNSESLKIKKPPTFSLKRLSLFKAKVTIIEIDQSMLKPRSAVNNL